MQSGSVDSVIILDDHGQIAYPPVAARAATADPGDDWKEAEFLEFKTDDLAAAAAYRAISAASDRQIAGRTRPTKRSPCSSAPENRARRSKCCNSCAHDDATDSIRPFAGRRRRAATGRTPGPQIPPSGARSPRAWRNVSTITPSKPCRADQRRFLMHALHAIGSNNRVQDALVRKIWRPKFVGTTARTVAAPEFSRRPRSANISQLRSPSGRVIALMNGFIVGRFS